MNNASKLIQILEQRPNSKQIANLINLAEKESCVDIIRQAELLRGVWELRWSSSKSPFLNYSPLLDNLQALYPDRCRGLNLLRPKGPLGNCISTNILADLDIVDQKRVNVTFKKAGLMGPQFFGRKIKLISDIKKTQEGWLDITVLTNKLRICRGYKGTIFALLKRNDISIADFSKYM